MSWSKVVHCVILLVVCHASPFEFLSFRAVCVIYPVTCKVWWMHFILPLLWSRTLIAPLSSVAFRLLMHMQLILCTHKFTGCFTFSSLAMWVCFPLSSILSSELLLHPHECSLAWQALPWGTGSFGAQRSLVLDKEKQLVEASGPPVWGRQELSVLSLQILLLFYSWFCWLSNCGVSGGVGGNLLERSEMVVRLFLWGALGI